MSENLTARQSCEKSRSAYWDNIKGVLMLLTVFAHFLWQIRAFPVLDTIRTAIYFFHMPAFVFASGYFGKSERSQSFGAIVKLAFLYFIFNSIVGFSFGFESLLIPLYSFWYLIAMIVWRLTAKYIARFKEIELILLAAALFAGFFSSIDNHFAIARIICFYPFYMAGYKLSYEKSEKLETEKISRRLPKGLLCLAGAAIIAAALLCFTDVTDNELLMYGYATPTDALTRIAMFAAAALMICFLRFVSVNKQLPLITKFGRNSLWIFLFHRPITLAAAPLLSKINSAGLIALVSAAGTLAICLVFGSDFAAKILNQFANAGAAVFTGQKTRGAFSTAAKAAAVGVVLGFAAMLLSDVYSSVFTREDDFYAEPDSSQSPQTTAHAVLSSEQKTSFDNAFRLTFAGDLILLEDQVKRGYNGDGYDFSDVFGYAEKYISSADFAVGVFEGPAAGAEVGFSSSNYGDGKTLALNFPDEFAKAVKDAGFDLVTTANNHVLDKGEAAAAKTLDTLDKIGLDHTGSYRNAEEKSKNRVKIVEADGIRLAVLSYTYGSNNFTAEELANGELSYLTSVISGTEGALFEQLKRSVVEDFKAARAENPDLIVVLPHMGTQFSNAPDPEQEKWFGIFKELGADIILGDHSHAVQPAFIENYGGKNVFTAYCPGNFANIYRKDQGDASMLIDVYINRSTKKIIGGSVVPLYTMSPVDGNFTAIPTFDIENSPELRTSISTDDFDRANAANRLVTKVVFGEEMDITAVPERYYFNENGYLREKTGGLELTPAMKQKTLYKALQNAKTACFIGDSLTEGTKNGGCPWYEPIEELFPETEFKNFSKGGCTASYLIEQADNIPAAELYVIAVGTNDVRYRDESVCAMTAEEFSARLGELKEKLRGKSPNAEFVFIAPWYSTDGDSASALGFSEKTALNEEYSAALEKFCRENKCGFINANEFIKDALSKAPESEYLLDSIHPNAKAGVLLYSKAVLNG